jgi:hypothetical protein
LEFICLMWNSIFWWILPNLEESLIVCLYYSQGFSSSKELLSHMSSLISLFEERGKVTLHHFYYYEPEVCITKERCLFGVSDFQIFFRMTFQVVLNSEGGSFQSPLCSQKIMLLKFHCHVSLIFFLFSCLVLFGVFPFCGPPSSWLSFVIIISLSFMLH